MPPLTPDLAVIDVAFVASVASFFGAAFIVTNWCCNSSARRLFFMRLIVFLSIANMGSSIAYILSFVEWRFGLGGGAYAVADDRPQTWCLAQALTMVVFENASILWTVAIALALHQQVVARRAAYERLERWYHLVCWGVPLALAAALFFGGMLGQSDDPHRATWCWIAEHAGSHHRGNGTSAAAAPPPPSRAPRKGAHVPFISDGAGADDRWIQLVAFYVPLLLAFALNAAIYIRVGRTFRRMARSGAVDAAKERVIQLRLRLYLLIFLCVWALPLAHRSLELAGYDPQWLRLGHTVTQCSMGWLNGLVYGCNEATLRPFRDAFGQIGCSLLRGIQLTPVGWRRSRDAALSSSSSRAVVGSASLGGGGGGARRGDVSSSFTASLLGSQVGLRVDEGDGGGGSLGQPHQPVQLDHRAVAPFGAVAPARAASPNPPGGAIRG